MKTLSRFLLFLFSLFPAGCMPEEDLPIRDVGDTPEYFIECYCQPGQPYTLSATNVLPVSEDLQIDFSKEMKVTIYADKAIPLLHSIYTLPGSEFVYNYGSAQLCEARYTDSLFLDITTLDHQKISASTSIPPTVSIYDCHIQNDEAVLEFYTSKNAGDNYYIYTAEILSRDSILSKETCFLNYSESSSEELIEKSLILPKLKPDEKVVFSLKRITQANYEYQISLNAANSANQSSITTPVPLKGNLKGALGIFTCYTEDRKILYFGTSDH